MIYGSVCSGIEAATVAWHPLGWRPAWFAEIDKFPSTVLAHHYPEVPNLGDFTRIDESAGAIDLLVGGSPCQDFSIAGLRAGLDGERGNLTLEFVKLARRLRPRWVVWENVPGVLSLNGGRAFGAILDALNDSGYSIDFDILDACHFGVPQRRRRVFVIGQSVEHGRKAKTTSFASMAVKCLTDLLLSISADLCDPSSIGAKNSTWPKMFSADGVRRRMKLFGLSSQKEDSLKSLMQDLEDALATGVREPDKSGCHFSLDGEPPESSARNTADDQLLGINQESACLSTWPSWKAIWADVCAMENASTILTSTNGTIESKIYTCAQASLLIAKFITPLVKSYPNCFDGDSSGLTALLAFTNYARQATESLFGNMDGVCDWAYFVESSTHVRDELERCLGKRAHTGSLLPIPHSLQGHPAPRREAGKDVAPTIAARTRGGGELGTDFDCDGGLIAKCLNAGAQRRIDAESETLIADLATEYAVRRITPTEAERLQGFPDGYTAITYREKPAADGPRYKALGNSMAVPVMRWIGERIQMIENLVDKP